MNFLWNQGRIQRPNKRNKAGGQSKISGDIARRKQDFSENKPYERETKDTKNKE